MGAEKAGLTSAVDFRSVKPHPKCSLTRDDLQREAPALSFSLWSCEKESNRFGFLTG